MNCPSKTFQTGFQSTPLDSIASCVTSTAHSRIAPLETYIGLSVQGRGFALILIGAFAAIALALSMVGIYGVTAYNIGQRTREISIRLALGARPNKLLRLILWQGMVLVICGVIVGVLASIALTRFLGSLLFKVQPTDPVTFGGVALLLVAVSAAACFLPAKRAMQVDPALALRHE